MNILLHEYVCLSSIILICIVSVIQLALLLRILNLNQLLLNLTKKMNLYNALKLDLLGNCQNLFAFGLNFFFQFINICENMLNFSDVSESIITPKVVKNKPFSEKGSVKEGAPLLLELNRLNHEILEQQSHESFEMDPTKRYLLIIRF